MDRTFCHDDLHLHGNIYTHTHKIQLIMSGGVQNNQLALVGVCSTFVDAMTTSAGAATTAFAANTTSYMAAAVTLYSY